MIAPLGKHVFIERTHDRRDRPRRLARIGRAPARLLGRGRRRAGTGLPI